MPQSKQCAECGATFTRKPHRSHAQWATQTCCTTACANTVRAKQQGKLASTTRREGERWARWWEQQRRREERAEQARESRRRRKVARATTPLAPPRYFIGSHCRACGATWVQYVNRDDSDLCSACTKIKWRMNHRHRARYYGVEHEHVDPYAVFASDGYRCQICHRKTTGKHPHPRSPTIDHIVPLSKGGPHLLHNVQTACLACNTKKGNGTANDQLRLSLT